MTTTPVPPRPTAPRPPNGIPTPATVAAPAPVGGWWVVRHALDDHVVTSYRDRAEAEEHADRAALVYGRRVFVYHSVTLP